MKSINRHINVAVLIATAFVGVRVAGAEAPSSSIASASNENTSANDVFMNEVEPLLTKYCATCHGQEKPEADLNLTKTKDLPGVLRQRELWQAVLEQLRNYAMPPEGKPQPSSVERQKVVEVLETEFARADHDRRGPGRVTMRRLNRTEYDNTVRDLLGIDFHASDDFPSDDVGYGFDNIGDVLSLPPILMEKYLTASEKIAITAVVSPETAKPQVTRVEAKDLASTIGDQRGGYLYTNGQVYATLKGAASGEYTLRVRVWGQPAGDALPHLVMKVDETPLKAYDVAATKDSPQECCVTFQAEPGEHKIAVEFTNDYYEKQEGMKPLDRNLTVDWIEVTAPVSMDPASLPESHRRIVTCRPTSESDRFDCSRQVIEPLASRAFRRPVSEDETARLTRLVGMVMDQGDSFERGVQLALQAILVSPYFLFRVEEEPTAAHGTYELNDYELASRLSYFLWSSMPDDELFSLASAGKLRDPNVLAEQARRMLADPRSQSLVANFSSQWLQTRNLSVVTPGTIEFSDYDPALADAMRIETEMFFATVMRENMSLTTFLDADFTFVNQRLARHYGMEGIEGPEFRRVTVSDGKRGGILTLGSVLTVTSNPTRTSPVKRGKWILENILGTSPPPPPPDVPELSEDPVLVNAGTLRQRLESHRSNAACASCHSRMDPLGFGLENYDGIGAWRDRDSNFPVDASGVLPDGESFNGPGELKNLLKHRLHDFATCMTEKMMTYALGRGLEYTDKYTVDEIVSAVGKDDYRFSTLVVEIVRSEAFVKRASAGSRL
jgi:hypothetical protein